MSSLTELHGTADCAPADAGRVGPDVVRISIVILTLNEETNIADCLRSCAWSDDVHVLDSGSTDRTCDIAGQSGATVHIHPFESFGRQRNWAIDHINAKYDWIFHLDADERFTPELVKEMRRIINADPSESGFYVPNKLMFLGHWLKHSSGYPIYQMRLFHKAHMRFMDYGHGQREDGDGPIGQLRQPYIHYNFSKGISDWIDRHNRYSTLEAEAIVAGQKGGGASVAGSLLGGSVQRRRFFKVRVYPNLPSRWIWRFVYMYFIKLGFLDGLAGFRYSLLVSAYELFTSLKVSEIRARQREKRSDPIVFDAKVSGSNGDGELAAAPNAKLSESPRTSIAQMRNTSPWTTREKFGRSLWMLCSGLLFRLSFHNWYAWRRMILRMFGAKIGNGVRIRPTANIEIPWHLEIGDNAVVGDFAILYSLGKIRIGKMSVISQYAHLCAGTHDYKDPLFPLLRLPITVGDDVWIAADAFIGPGVVIGDRAVVGARSTVVRPVLTGQVVAGNPACVLKTREPGELPLSARNADV